MNKSRLLIDMDDCLCDFTGSHTWWKNKFPEITYPQSQFGFFSNLEPLDGAIEAFKELEKHFEVYILTRPSIYNLMCYTEKADWVKKHLGFHTLERLILACDKSMVKGDYLVDDSIADGQLDFEGELIRFGSDEFKNWNDVLKYLIK